jgi:mannose-1-phosphate guanylyltransferase/mannose-6-phosphate isomerase
MLVPVILSGGSGTRLWPLSRELHPKQFLPLVSELSLLQDTVRRTDGLSVEAPIIVCNEQHRFMVAEQMRQMDRKPTAIVLEPAARNTAPAVALAAFAAMKACPSDPNVMILVLPADHQINDTDSFVTAVQKGLESAKASQLVTFGVIPDAPETGYGYIKKGPASGSAYHIAQFVEKPDRATAEAYLKSEQYLWNSGMFLFEARRYLEELKQLEPAMYAACEQAVHKATQDLDFTRVDLESFKACPSNSIDYAVMEKTKNAVVVPLSAGWSDVGSWASLRESLPQDDNGNVMRGDVVIEDTQGCYLHAEHRLVTAVGLANHVVVETRDAVFVAPNDRAQDVKALVNKLKSLKRSEVSLHREVARPWGSYDSIDFGDRFQVKRLTVKPGAQLSLQMHHHRAEHWIVVSGTALITCAEKEFLLSENESTYIPVGATHRISNPGKVPLHIIEVQSGSYLGEDDIVRFEDNYGREGTRG